MRTLETATPGEPGRPMRDAAVVVPVFRDAGGTVRVVVIVRTDHGIHGGQLAFPGGNIEAGDATPLDTALREAEEEIGLARERVEVLATLPIIVTVTTGYRIAPFLARIAPPAAWRPDPNEVAEVLELSVEDLTDPAAQAEAVERVRGWSEPRHLPYIRVGARRLWGASYRILHPLLPRLAADEWKV